MKMDAFASTLADGLELTVAMAKCVLLGILAFLFVLVGLFSLGDIRA